MVMALLISFLLLVAGAGLILEAAVNSANMTDATAEQQAYHAAESGIQAAVHVLRCQDNTKPGCGDVVSNPLIDNSKPATDKANQINYVKALQPQTSNVGVTGLDANARMSRWLNYSATRKAANDIVKLEDPAAAYNPMTGYAYALQISDPDNTGSVVSYTTKATLSGCDLSNPLVPTSPCADLPYPHITFTNGAANAVRITYFPTVVPSVDLSVTPAPTVNFGKFKVEILGTGAPIPAFQRFEIVVDMTVPYRAKKVLRGFIETNTGATNVPPKIIIDSQSFNLQGSLITLDFNSGAFVNFPDALPQRVGYEAALNSGDNTLSAAMTPPEPVRLRITSTGYGPRGAVKQLEAIIQKNFFNGLGAPATLTLIGPASASNGPFTFNPGTSNVTTYSGDDVVSTDIIPPIGTTDPSILTAVQTSVDRHPPHPFNGNVVGTPSDVNSEMPDWLSSTSDVDKAIHDYASLAVGAVDPANTGPGVTSPYYKTSFYPQGQTPTVFGDNSTGSGITFCDGDVTFTGNGGGIMVVTGKLTLKGNFNFKGIIIVTGSGGVDRSGGGNGVIEGNIVVAPYDHSRIEDTATIGATFLSPQYNLDGGGSSSITYNSSSVAAGLSAVSNFVLGVLER